MKSKLKKHISMLISLVLIIQIILPCYASASNIPENSETRQSQSDTLTITDKSHQALINRVTKPNGAVPSGNGIWVNEASQAAFLEMLNSVCNKSYAVNASSFLYVSDNAGEANTYDEKIGELINANKKILVAIDDAYDAYNEATNETYSLAFENGEFTALFKPTDNLCVAVLNFHHYNDHSDNLGVNDADEFDEPYYYSNEELTDYFLEAFYPDTDFVELTKDEIDERLANLPDKEIIAPYALSAPETLSDSAEFVASYNDFQFAFMNLASGGNFDAGQAEEYLSALPSQPGIWLDSASAGAVLRYINIHTIYTYTVDANGYLKCDYVKKENPNLDFFDVSEVDEELDFMLKSGRTTIIGAGDSLFSKEDGLLKKVSMQNDEYVKTYDSEDGTSRLVMLNSAYFNDFIEYNPAMSDRFIKSLFPLENVARPLSLDGATGTMNVAKTVYFGPSSSNYATVGSVSVNEDIAIMGKTANWYFIVYFINGTQNLKSGYVPVSSVSNVSGRVEEEVFEGGYNYSASDLTVKSSYIFESAVNSGTIYALEGFTELDRYSENGRNISLVEYSTSSGTKRGFVSTSSMQISSHANSSVARVVRASTPAYAGPDNSYVKLGGAYENEYVAILAKGIDWAFVEYNTSSGRKRGYVQYSHLENCYTRSYPDLKSHLGVKKATLQLTVYAGPNNNYANIGTIFNQEVVSFLGNENGYSYIEYSTTNGAKRGYVSAASLADATTPALPSIPTYANFTSGSYGTSGAGDVPLKWYKIGSGNNVAFTVFEQHGWEDAWAADGIELVNIANTMMSKLSAMDQSRLNDWTIYVIPYANPDGIISGYTNNGPGRCTMLGKVDMNRCWPANFVPYYTSRNYTGDAPLGALEAVFLKSFIDGRMGSGTNVVLDIHGWLNKTYGNSEVASYFGQQFGFSHNNTHGKGYLETWAFNQGAKSCLIELPEPASSGSIVSGNYAGKLADGLVNMVQNIKGGSATEGGTVVNQSCRVQTNSSVNVRSGPGTAYSKVASLTNGTQVTRIKLGVATANGYVWDKIAMSDGKIGYMATNYLVLITDNSSYEKYQSYDEIMAVKAFLKYETDIYSGVIDKMYNNELIGAVEEWQKAFNLSVQDGSLNAETLQDMGFTVGTNGRIANDAQYATYINIANNYLNDSYVHFDELPGESTNILPERKYMFGTTETRSDDEYYDKVELENGLYDSMSEADRQNKRIKMEATKKTLDGTCAFYKKDSNLKHAYQAIQRYMDNNGQDLVFDDISTMFLIDHETLKKAALINDCKRVAEHYLTNLNSCKFAMEYDFNTQIAMFDEPAGNFTTDWFLACNYFKMGCNATASKSGSSYSMTLNITIKDFYYWDDDSSPWPAETEDGVEVVIERDVRDLHLAGKARNFEDFGRYTIQINW